jgi:hypothetical protein
MKYITSKDLKNCNLAQLKDQLNHHSKPYEEWEKDRVKYIKKLINESSKQGSI